MKFLALLMENRIISFFNSCQTVDASRGKVYKAFYEPMILQAMMLMMFLSMEIT